MTHPIIEFIEARLRDESRLALAASKPAVTGSRSQARAWEISDDGCGCVTNPSDGAIINAHDAGDPQAVAAHVAHHDPCRVLGTVMVMQDILAEHPHLIWPGRKVDHLYCERCHVEDGVIEGDGRPCQHVRLLASLWGDHPGYMAEWRPDLTVEART